MFEFNSFAQVKVKNALRREMKCEITLGTQQYASESEFRCKSVMQMKSANDKI